MRWTISSLADVADFDLGKMLDKEKNRGDLRPYLANLNVRWGAFDLTDLRQMKFTPEEFDRYSLLPGDIVMCEGGEPGRCAYWNGQYPGMMFQKAIHRIRAKRHTDSKFLFYALLDLGTRNQLEGLFTGATIKHLPRAQLALVKVPSPPLSIQARIAEILSAYDDLIEVNTRRIKALEEMVRRTYEEWFVHYRFPGGEGTRPDDWADVPIQDLYEGLFDGPHATPKPSEEGPAFLGIKNIREEGGLDLSSVRHIAEADFSQWTRRVLPRAGDIIFSYEATLHRYAIIPAALKCCLGRRMALIRPKAEFRYFVYFTFFSLPWRQTVAQRQISGATVDRISLTDFPSFPILRPSENWLASFEKLAGSVFSMIQSLNSQNTNLRAQRDLLLPRLISGEIDVSDAVRPEAMAAE